MEKNAKTIYLVDGTALVYRSYFAFIKNPLVNSRGEDTSASYGFSNTIMSLIRDRKPDYLAIAFDTRKATFRHEMYDAYKATRQKMPDELAEQLPRVREAAEAMGIPILEIEGVEADDVIGTLAVNAAAEGLNVVMVTGDKDFMQLVDGKIKMLSPAKNDLIGEDGVVEKFGVKPTQIIDLLSLMGDSSDNVPGVPRVGEKTAVQLLTEFGSLDQVLERFEEISKPSIKKSIGENREMALLSRRLVTIKTDVELPCKLDDLVFEGVSAERAREFFLEMEFTRLVEDVRHASEDIETPVNIVDDSGLESLMERLNSCELIAVDLETTSIDPMLAEIVGVSLAACDEAWYLPVGHSEGPNMDADRTLDALKGLLENPSVGKVGHNIKYDATILRRYGVETAPIVSDTMVAAYVLDPGSRGYSLDKLADTELHHGMQSITELIGKGKNQVSFAEVPVVDAARYSCDDAFTTLRLETALRPRIENEGMNELYEGLEMPLLTVLMDTEMHGVCLDQPFLAGLSDEFATMMADLEKQIYAAAGEEFNINSPKQLGVILFDKMGLKARRKTKTGYSTDIDTLTALVRQHELPGLILDYRQLAKLKSTYIDALPAMLNPETDRVHTSFNQAVAATGRLSSSDPNLQNIPVRTELGRQIREAFIAPQGYVLLSADYSQIELRIMAHMSKDALLTEAFVNGEDVHKKTASHLFNTFPVMVTDDQRRQAKTINFGVMYGMGAYALSEQLGIKRAEAKEFIDNYFATHSGVSAFIDTTVEEARKNGYVTTLLGRKRYVTDILSENRNVAEFAKRTAINTPIQGSAADLIKRSMIEMSKRLREEDIDAYMILQVHDELVFEVAEDQVERLTTLVREVMEGAMELDVPLVVDIGTGKNWLEAH